MIDETAEGLPLGREVRVGKGLFIERRCFLAATASALASTGFLPGTAYARLSGADSISFEEFLAAVLPEAKRLVADVSTSGQDLYLKTLAKHAARLSDAPEPSWNDSGQSLTPGTFIGANTAPSGGTTEPFVLLHWRMDPGTRIEAHAHTYGNVCTLGLEGEVRVSNFEMEGARDFDVTRGFVARRTVVQKLVRGTVNLVSLDRNYVHGSVAGPGGGRGLDITTRIKPRRPGVPYLLLERRKSSSPDLFEARWTDLSAMRSQDPSLNR